MYSPKIKEDLIPILYRLAKKQRQPMTAVVDRILREKLREFTNRNPLEGDPHEKKRNQS
jgi:hypothetical protein